MVIGALSAGNLAFGLLRVAFVCVVILVAAVVFFFVFVVILVWLFSEENVDA